MECAIPTSKKRKILVCCFGSRGDVQPFAALARGLQDAGFQVLGMTNVDYGVSLFEGLGVPAEGVHFDLANMIRTDPKLKRAMASGKAVQLGLTLSKAFVHHFPKEFSKQWEVAKRFQPDLMVATSLLWLQASAIGQALRVPVVHADLGLFSMLPISKHTETELHEPKVLHKMASFVCVTSITVALFQKNKDGESLMDAMRRHLFGPQSSGGGGLDEASERLLGQDGGGQFAREWMNPLAPNLFGVSEVVLPKSRFTDLPPVYAERTVWTGNWFVSQELQEELARQGDPNYSNNTNANDNDNDNNDSDTVQTTVLKFLRHQAQLRQTAGQSPVAPAYIGWGSMVAVSPEHMTRVAVTSLKVAGLPGIVLGGFARLRADLLPADQDLWEYASKHVLFLQSAPHDWLFPHCSVTVHHGGAGTTAAALRSGVPTIVTPCIADQFDNATLIEALGCGMGFRKPLRKITESQLAQAMIQCVSDNKNKNKNNNNNNNNNNHNHNHKDMATSSTSIAKNCQRVAQALGQEDGIATAVHELQRFFHTRVDSGQWKQDFEARLEQRAKAPWSTGRALYRVLFSKEPFVE